MAGFYRLTGDGAELFVRLTPRSSRDCLDGIERSDNGRSWLAVRVRAIPDKGAANAALESLLAAKLCLPRRSVVVVSGTTARFKILRITSPPDNLGASLTALTEQANKGKPG